jgi:SAM-dependent methyltransferase
MLKVLSRFFSRSSGVEKKIPYKPSVFDKIHEEDEMYLFFTTHPQHKDHPIQSYFESGEGMMHCLNEILLKAGTSFNQIDSFLEFACGYGRFTRHLIEKIDSKRVTVSDIYQKAVDFQKKAFGVRGFYSKTNPEELDIPGRYDVIFVASLFSHLPCKNWGRWINKLYSALNEGGLLIFSTHGTACMENADDIPEEGFLFLPISESNSLSCDEYGTTYVTNDFVASVVKRETGQDIEFMVEKFLWTYQDVYVVRRPIVALK